MRKRLFLPAVLPAVVLLLFSCVKDESVSPGPENAFAPAGPAVERSHWKKKEIPNSVSNIRLLYAERLAEVAAAAGANGGPSLFGGPSPDPDPVIEATHYYVRFEPDDDEEYYMLKEDENLDLYSHPLDCEIPEGAVSYVDPEQPLDKPQFLFGIMPADYTPGTANYTILDEIVREPSVDNLEGLITMLSGGFGGFDDGPGRGGGTKIDNGDFGTGTGHLQGGANAESIANHDINRPPSTRDAYAAAYVSGTTRSATTYPSSAPKSRCTISGRARLRPSLIRRGYFLSTSTTTTMLHGASFGRATSTTFATETFRRRNTTAAGIKRSSLGSSTSIQASRSASRRSIVRRTGISTVISGACSVPTTMASY